ncbi:nucleotidyltransferase domain-containing protein [Natronorubrum bangense]|uniref:Uncharacterized protein n=2 Tax=Natronorubrum bangense TaxID=61858 RepID=L9WJJ2_9EURY|nr:hypothetical protein [Natronorubrum bangense]ELY49665.1 hypothetical protein C494_06610 [Natronorubrum bangense JCM 10635]QCC56925.1 hypothetical protein DV706_20525 [Natronorubrum bangense]
MPPIEKQYLNALETLSATLDGRLDVWALTGSTSFVLQGVPLTPNDIDVQTTEDGAYAIEKLFAEEIVEPISFSETETICSHFGAFELDDVRVEVMGAIQKRQSDGTWEPPVDISEHRRFVDLDDIRIPVLSLQYEAEAYEALGRSERANLLSEYIEE